MNYTFEDLKKMASSFVRRLPTSTLEQIENGWHMFCVAYLNTIMDTRQRESEGPALYRVIYRQYALSIEKV